MKSGGIAEILETGTFPGITGTRDGFKFRNQFIDERTGKTIDNYKDWERAGYREDDCCPCSADMKQMIKEKKKDAKRKKKLAPDYFMKIRKIKEAL